MLKRRIVQYWTTIKDTCKKHRKTAIAILLLIAVAAGGSVGYKVMTSTDSGVASDEQKLEQAKEAEEEAISEEKKAEEELEKAKKSGDKEAIEEAEKKVEAAKEKVSSAKKEVASANKGSSNKANTSSSKNNSSTKKPSSSTNKKPSNSGSSSANKPSKPSSGNSGSSGSSGSSSSGSSNSKPSKPAHQHKWEPVYGERQVPYEVDESYWATICTDCGLENPSITHIKEHIKNGGNGGTKDTFIEKLVTKYKTEKYIDHYECSCGATK